LRANSNGMGSRWCSLSELSAVGDRPSAPRAQQNPIDGKALWRRQFRDCYVVQPIQQGRHRRIGEHRLGVGPTLSAG
jgi:hypothetical protein